MKIIKSLPLFLLLLTGCTATQYWAKGVATKNISGNGTFIDTHVGLNTETKIPEVKATFITGDISSTKADTNSITYRQQLYPSMWSSSGTVRKRFLTITINKEANMSQTIKAIAEVLQTDKDAE